MKNVIDGLNHWMNIVPKEFNRMSEVELSERPLPNKWSKKETLGHLCDSAINNLGRFINIQYEKQPYVIASYNQDQWAALQNYQKQSTEEILNLWCALNKQIIQVINKIPAEKLSYRCDLGNNEQKTLEWLIQDYLEHMEHHINNQLFK
ncbi:DinB family protein [Priestia megaterium]|nr:DinB family protein [Priestia megaterium]